MNNIDIRSLNKISLFKFLDMVSADSVELCKYLEIEVKEENTKTAKKALNPYIQGKVKLTPYQWRKIEERIREKRTAFEMYFGQIKAL